MNGKDFKFYAQFIPDDAHITFNRNMQVELTALDSDLGYYNFSITAGWELVKTDVIDGLYREIERLYERIGQLTAQASK